MARAAAFPGDEQSFAGLLLDLASVLVPAREPVLRNLGRSLTSRLRPISGDVGDAHHRRRLDRVREIVAAGELTAWEVALQLWGPRKQLYEKRLALQEGLAHLQALAVDGVLEKLVSPDSVRWRTA